MLICTGVSWVLTWRGVLVLTCPGVCWVLTCTGVCWVLTCPGVCWVLTCQGVCWVLTCTGVGWVPTCTGVCRVLTWRGVGCSPVQVCRVLTWRGVLSVAVAPAGAGAGRRQGAASWLSSGLCTWSSSTSQNSPETRSTRRRSVVWQAALVYMSSDHQHESP